MLKKRCATKVSTSRVLNPVIPVEKASINTKDLVLSIYISVIFWVKDCFSCMGTKKISIKTASFIFKVR